MATNSPRCNFQIDSAQNIHAMRGGGDAFGERGDADGGGRDGRLTQISLQFFIMALGGVHYVRSVSFRWMSRGSVRFNAIWLRRVTTCAVSIRDRAPFCSNIRCESRSHTCRALTC